MPFAALRAEVYEYDPVANTWATKADNPTPRHSIVAASASNGKVYVFGGVPVGSSPYTCTGIVQEYDPTGDSWSTKTSMPTGRCGAGAAQATNGKIYVVGGTPSSGNPSHLATVEEYDPITDSWATKASMPAARGGLVLVAASNGKLYAIGGHNTTPGPVGGPLAVVDVYDPATDTWASGPPLQQSRAGLGAAIVDDKIYAIGGTSVFGPLYATNEVLDISGKPVVTVTYTDESTGGPYVPGTWTRGPVVVSFSCMGENGIPVGAAHNDTAPSGAGNTYPASIRVSKTTLLALSSRWRCVDSAGNAADPPAGFPANIRIDKLAPKCAVVFVPTIAKGANALVAIKTNSSDAGGSGLASTKLASIVRQQPGAALFSGATIGAAVPQNVTFQGATGRSWKVTLLVSDNAGNTATCTKVLTGRN